MVQSSFSNVGIVGRANSEQVVSTIQQLIHLLDEHSCTVILDRATSGFLAHHSLTVVELDALGGICDLVIVVGGDGSLLGVARSLADYNVPVLGINRGRLGFLTDIKPTEVEVQVSEVLAGKYTVEPRFLLNMEVYRGETPVYQACALNDVVLHAGAAVHMIDFDLYMDDQFVYNQSSDGVIIATPTGSTAYALAGGGPIMHPKLDAIVVVPMHPHTLSSRPIVVDSSTEIKLVVESTGLKPCVSCDGQTSFTLELGDILTVNKKPEYLQLLHPKTHDFYSACRSKLGWGNTLKIN